MVEKLVVAQLLQALIAYEELTDCMNKTDSGETFKVKKGVKLGVGYDPGLQRSRTRKISTYR